MMLRIASKQSFERFSKLFPTKYLLRVAGMSTITLDTARAPTAVLRKLSSLSNPSLLKIASLPRCSFSSLSSTESELFNYTSGRWVYNEALRLQERKLVFDVDEFMQLAARSVDRRSSDIINFSKLAEGDHNRILLITFNDNFQMVARVPYPVTGPKYYGLASEVATMEYLRLSGIPVPEVYGYDPGQDNAVGMAYSISGVRPREQLERYFVLTWETRRLSMSLVKLRSSRQR
ncbi:hypothetical protein BKA70DRAFT_886916 [Coprinopsis sp. MPI-PUGE-AT-0042]|nr:hypothetical protein BKA70DRAFT_886916 [Coprinopsis sp. MPI-PUGE-AT-0042]